MRVALIGISHKTVPVSLRERFAFSSEELPRALARLRRAVGNGVVLSTCNRTELYYVTKSGQAKYDQAARLLAAMSRVPSDELAGRCYFLLHEDAIRHLHRVAAGLESMAVGETEILGQVRTAFVAACEAGCANPLLTRLFHAAIRAGRRARAETFIGRYAASVSSTAVTLAKAILGDLSDRTVLVVGAGEAGKLTAHSLSKAGACRMLVANRTYGRAAQQAALLGGRAVPFAWLPQALEESDIVISCSGAPSFVVREEMVAAAMARRDGRPLVLIDIAVPRDIDPAVKDFPGVHLYDIDDLQAVSTANLRKRRKELSKVEAIVEEEVSRFLAWWHSLKVIPTITALRGQVEGMRQRELAKTFARLPHLAEEDRESIEALTGAIVKKVLHEPLVHLRDRGEDEDYLEVVRDLFGLDEGRADLAAAS